MDRLLLDSNIVIYFLKGDRSIIEYLDRNRDAQFFLSIISWIEVLAGSAYHNKTLYEVESEISQFIKIPIDQEIGKKAALLFNSVLRSGQKIKNFQDGIIAATALTYKLPLITNNPKDFQRFKELTVMSPGT